MSKQDLKGLPSNSDFYGEEISPEKFNGEAFHNGFVISIITAIIICVVSYAIFG